APGGGGRKRARADELAAGRHVEQPVVDVEAAVALAGEASGDQRLGVEDAPVLEPRAIEVDGPFDERRRIDRREQARALEIGGDDLAHPARRLAVGRGAAGEIRDRDGHRLDVALGDVEPHGGAGVTQRREDGRTGGGAGQKGAAIQHGLRQGGVPLGHGPSPAFRRRPNQLGNMYWGLKLISISFQASYFATGRKLKGAQARIARKALSAATWKNGWALRLSTRGSFDSDPSRSSSICTSILRSLDSAAPAGRFQRSAKQARSASISLCDSVGAWPLLVPRLGVALSVSPV